MIFEAGSLARLLSYNYILRLTHYRLSPVSLQHNNSEADASATEQNATDYGLGRRDRERKPPIPQKK